VFHAGADGKEEAVAIFTDQSRAAACITAADREDEFEVGQLQPIQLPRWLVTAYHDGTRLRVVDSDRQSQMCGTPQNVLMLDDPLNALAHLLGRSGAANRCRIHRG
jgi:hypothetical protein